MTDHTTVGGLGVGLFLIIFVWVIAIFGCLAFARSSGGLSNIGLVLVLFAILFSVILLVLPRENFEEPSTKIYDYTVIFRSLLISACALFLIIGLVAFLAMHLMEPVYAKPIRRLKLS